MEYRRFPSVERRNLTQELLEVRALVKFMHVPSGVRMLEIGCGRGIALPPIDKLCSPRRLVGLDIDAEALADAERHCRERGVGAHLVLGDVRALPFDEGEFDFVIDFGTCYHISRPDLALEEISRVLEPGGVFCYETRASQLLSHPVRSFGKSLPWRAITSLKRIKRRFLWASRVKLAQAS
jgi:ubiquinone/menaquinone biosynthesis C-methylase UbiE